MPDATYDGNYAPIPWKALSQFKEDRGKVCTWIEDALGGVVVPDCSVADAMLIVGAINAHNDLVKAQQETLMLMQDEYDDLLHMACRKDAAGKPIRNTIDEDCANDAKVYEDLIAMTQAALAKAKPVEATELKPLISEEPAAPAPPPVDIEALGAKARELAAADGWPEPYPGEMPKAKWREYTAQAMKELQS